MGWANKLIGWASGNGVEVSAANELLVKTTTASGILSFVENDPGLATSDPYIMSPEVDDDYRMRVAHDRIEDEEDLTYTSQNFTKHYHGVTTFVPSWTATGYNTNPTSLLTSLATALLKTYKTFSMEGTETLSFDFEGAFTIATGPAIPANTIFEAGFGITANTTPFDCFDGVFIRFTNGGVQAVIRNNSAVDTSTSANFLGPVTGNPAAPYTTWTPVSGRRYQFIVYLTPRETAFWIRDPVADAIWLAAELQAPAGFGAPIASQGTNIFVRQYNSGTPTVASSFTLSRYSVRKGGSLISADHATLDALANDSILSPGTLTTTANQTVTTGSIVASAAGVPANATSLLASLSGKVQETLTLAAGTDGILMSFQNPALPVAVGTSYAPNKCLMITGVSIASSVVTALTGGGISKHFYLAYGSTSLSLAGVATDTATTKAYRRIQLPIVQAYAAAQAAGTLPSGDFSVDVELDRPIPINPGEFVALCTYHVVGTAVTAGAAMHAIRFVYHRV